MRKIIEFFINLRKISLNNDNIS